MFVNLTKNTLLLQVQKAEFKFDLEFFMPLKGTPPTQKKRNAHLW